MEALADGRWARGDRAAAVGWLAHAYEAAPEAPEALEKLVDLYKEARLDAQPMTAPERAEWHYLAGMVDDEAGRSAEALEHYEAALAADGSRWDACCNALHLLLNAPDRDQRRRIPGLLAAVPRALAWERPQLLANAALYLAGEGRLAEAREHLERVRELVDDQGPLADLVRERLADLGAS